MWRVPNNAPKPYSLFTHTNMDQRHTKPNLMYFHTAGVTVQLANVGSREIRPWGLESSRAFDDRTIDRSIEGKTDGRTGGRAGIVRFASSEGTELILI